MNINEAHRKWGHPSYAKMKSMAEVARIKLYGEEEQCDACGVSKVKCNPIPKATETHATQPGERIFIDTSGPFPSSLGGSKYWRGAVDDYSGFMFMEFGRTKDGMIDFVRKILAILKGKEMKCKFLRCDNAGEHFGLVDVCNEYGVKIEFTPPYSPQYNGHIERRFAVVTQRRIAMMYDAGFSKSFRSRIWGRSNDDSIFFGRYFSKSERFQTSI